MLPRCSYRTLPKAEELHGQVLYSNNHTSEHQRLISVTKDLTRERKGYCFGLWIQATAHRVRDSMVAGSGGDIRKQEEMNAGTQPAFLFVFSVSVRVFLRQQLI